LTDPKPAAALEPGGSAGRTAIDGRILPLALFGALAAVAWFAGAVASQPDWLLAAAAHARASRELGQHLLRGLDPAVDPRLMPAAVLLRLGLRPEIVLALVRLVGLLIGAAAVMSLIRGCERRGPAPWAGAFWLAVSALWIEAALQGDPHVALGLSFLLVSRGTAPAWLLAAATAWCLGWSPWAWVALPPVLLGTLLDRSRARWRGPAILLVALAGLWIVHPLALLDPAGWWAGMWRAIHSDALWGSGPGVGLKRSLLPLTGSLHVSGLLLMLLAARGWARRCRSGDLAPVTVLAVLLLALRGSFASVTPVLMLLPWGAGEVGRGWRTLTEAWLRPRVRWAAAVLLIALLTPAVVVLAGRWQRPALQRTAPAEVTELLARYLPPGSLVVHDVGFTPPDSSGLVWLALPFHARDPALYAGAYWDGWFRAAAAFVVSEDLVVRLVRDPERCGAMVQFYVQLTETAREEQTLGGAPGHRTRVLVREPAADALGAGWRERLTAGAGRDLPGEFVAALGAGLTGSGRAGDTVQLLEQALTAGYRDLGVYLNLAEAHLKLDRVMPAGRVLDEAHRLYPDSPEVSYNLALALTQAGLWDRAIRTLAQVQRQWPRSAQVCYLLGVALHNQQQPAAARTQLERALELDPDLPQREAVLALLAELGGGQR
jgi:Flp pilus assembly protein TadD